jgi:hypothetical protein
MHPMVVRAILAIHLSPAGRGKLRDYERRILADQPGRYLTGFEITRCMKNKPNNPTDQELGRMESLWRDYERNQMRGGWELEREHPEVVPRDKLDEIYAWEDYAIEEYVRWMSEPFPAQQISNAVVAGPRERADLFG